MSEVDLSLAGDYLNSSDKLSDLDLFLADQGEFTESCMRCAMSALFGRIDKALNMKEDVFEKLSNTHKFYLVRGFLPEREQELRAFILERFNRFTS